MNAWVLLAVAIALEVTATSLLKAANGFARPLYGVAAMMLYSLCFWVMALIFTRLPIGVVYAIWSGVGVVGIALIGWLVYRQPLSLVQMGCIALILTGAVGLNLTVHHQPPANDATR